MWSFGFTFGDISCHPSLYTINGSKPYCMNCWLSLVRVQQVVAEAVIRRVTVHCNSDQVVNMG